MKNLKKGLSVFLGMIMLLSLMTYAAAASKTYADLTDKDEIENQEAVSLLVDLGIIEGMPDGSYSPTVTIDRATMAKLVCYVLMGDVDQSVFKGTTTDLKDINGNWAEGYIKFCYANGIIAGRGNGIFDPSAKVTVVEAAKMLNVALGYDPALQGYIYSDNWSVNIMKDANKSGMLAGVSLTATAPLDRDNAALMIYNLLFAKEVYYTDFTGSTPQYKNNTLGLATYGLVEFTGIVTGMTDETIVITVDGKAYTFDIAAEPTLLGHKVTVYAEVKTTQSTSNFVTSIEAVLTGGKYTIEDTISASPVIVDTVLATSVNGTTYAKLTAKTDSKYIGYAEDSSVAYYFNGVEYKTKDKDGNTINDTNTNGIPDQIETAVANIGTQVQFVDQDDDSKYDAVFVTQYFLSQVTDTTEAGTGTEAKVTIDAVKNNNGTLSYATGANGDAVPESLVVGDFSALEEEDYVMAAVIGSGSSANKVYVYETETFQGSLTGYSISKATLTIDGSAYYTSAAANESDLGDVFGTAIASMDATFYKDANGYIVGYGDAETEVKYVAVDAIAYVEGAGVNADGYAQAILVFSDGTASTVTVAKMDVDSVNGKATPIEAGKTLTGLYKSDGTTPITTTGVAGTVTKCYNASKVLKYTYVAVDTDTKANYNANLSSEIYSYTVNDDGKYVLTKVSGADAAAATDIIKGVAKAANVTANNSTVYVIKSSDSSGTVSYATYTGYKNVPTVKNAVVDVAKNSTTNVATFVYIDATGTTVGEATSSYVYVLNTDYDVDNSGSEDIYIFDAVVDGAVKTVKTKDVSLLNAVDLYSVTYDSNGYVIAPTTAQDETTVSGYVQGVAVGKAADGILQVDTTNPFNDATVDETYTYDGDETVYIIDASEQTVKTGSVSSVKDTNVVYVKVVDDTGTAAEQVAIDTLYVIVP